MASAGFFEDRESKTERFIKTTRKEQLDRTGEYT